MVTRVRLPDKTTIRYDPVRMSACFGNIFDPDEVACKSCCIMVDECKRIYESKEKGCTR